MAAGPGHTENPTRFPSLLLEILHASKFKQIDVRGLVFPLLCVLLFLQRRAWEPSRVPGALAPASQLHGRRRPLGLSSRRLTGVKQGSAAPVLGKAGTSRLLTDNDRNYDREGASCALATGLRVLRALRYAALNSPAEQEAFYLLHR